MGDIRAGGTSYFLSLAQAVSGEGDPGLLNPQPLPSSNKPQRLLCAEWGPPKHSSACGGCEKGIGRWHTGNMGRGPGRGQGASEP